MTYTHITVERSHHEKIATVTLRRPQVHNAFNAQVVADLTSAFSELSSDTALHAVILTGEGPSFSAGADLNEMKAAATVTPQENLNDALRLSNLLFIVNTCPIPIIARVNGTAMGGGLGLIAVCDLAIAAESARFAFSEVKLGIAPAVISPFIIRKIGESNARVLFVTGERFSAARALSIGLVHAVVPHEELDDAVQKAVAELLTSAPQAMRECKKLALSVGQMSYEQAHSYTAETIARLRVGAEGQEGLQAFLEKRKANWIA